MAYSKTQNDISHEIYPLGIAHASTNTWQGRCSFWKDLPEMYKSHKLERIQDIVGD